VGQGDSGPVVVTTWHSAESLADAIRFALCCTRPDDAFEACDSFIGISIANRTWFEEIRTALSDPITFAR
jgi:hypothetical protein